MSIRARILLATIAILVVTEGGLMLAADRWLRDSLERDFTEGIARATRLIATAIPHDPAQLAGAANRFGDLLGLRVTIIDSTGHVVGDSDFDAASIELLDNHLARPEIVAARDSGIGSSFRYSASTKRREDKVAVRAWPGYVRISAPSGQVDAVVAGAVRAVVLAALAALLIGVVLAVVVGRAIARPLAELGDAAQALAAGETPRYPTSTAPEVRQLVRAFRSMGELLAARMGALQRGREETNTLIESMVEGVLACDPHGNIAVCNEGLRRMFDFAPDAPIPNLRELFHNLEAREVVDQVLAGRAVLGREIAFDGRTVLVTARPLPDGGAVVCLHDISDLRRLEAVRRDFVANVSHELKTPLASIAGYAETLVTGSPDDQTQRKFLAVITQNVSRMQSLLDDLLDLARLESGGWTPATQELDVAGAAESAWASFATRAEERGVSFSVAGAEGKRVVADPEALAQILTNLFDNALRHTSSGGTVSVEARRVGVAMQLIVRDTGSGIPAEHLPRVFERFYRVNPVRSREHGGTGLGLSIVRHLVQAHEGRVDLESALGEGTTVRITLPLPNLNP
jgi:two-component system phosphate regulon sensor histidine kinase PhoR